MKYLHKLIQLFSYSINSFILTLGYHFTSLLSLLIPFENSTTVFLTNVIVSVSPNNIRCIGARHLQTITQPKYSILRGAN